MDSARQLPQCHMHLLSCDYRADSVFAVHAAESNTLGNGQRDTVAWTLPGSYHSVTCTCSPAITAQTLSLPCMWLKATLMAMANATLWLGLCLEEKTVSTAPALMSSTHAHEHRQSGEF